MMIPQISVIISTRNRGDSVVATLNSVFLNKYSSFEVILVDQSTNCHTAIAVEPFLSDPRFHFFHSESQGLGVSRNLGLKLSRGEIIAYTDDDCIVSKDWLKGIADILIANPLVAMIFCNVEAASYNSMEGYIPAYTIQQSRIIKSMRDLLRGFGIGAGMAFRRETVLSIGGFDNSLGAGSRFQAGEDHDIAIRILLNNWWIYEASNVTVTHFGFRYWSEGKNHTKRDSIGGGAAYVKPLKCGFWKIGIFLLFIPVLRGIWTSFSKLIHGKRPLGIKGTIYFIHGVLQGLKTPIDCKTGIYMPDKNIFIPEYVLTRD